MNNGHDYTQPIKASSPRPGFLTRRRVRLRNLVRILHNRYIKVREVIRMLQEDGRKLVRTRGSHHHFRHSTKPGTVTVPGNPNFDLHPKTLASILKQAGFRKEDAL